MLRIYYGRENIDKDRAMFNLIGRSMGQSGMQGHPSQILLLVPDQYTLQAERNAISLLNVKGLMDMEVLSFSRLAARILNETGGSRRTPIDKYGRHMLLAGILSKVEGELLTFKNMSGSHSFIDMANNLIAEMKQHNSSPAQLKKIIGELDGDSLLRRKLNDISIIFENYEERIADKYIDTEDHLDLFISKISKSVMVRESELWISGFDSFTPKSAQIIEELSHYSKGVNLVITYDDAPRDKDLFRMTGVMIRKLEEAVGAVQIEKHRLDSPCSKRKAPIKHLERQIFAHRYDPFTGGEDVIRFCRAANFYNEAETAASYISQMVREKGLRFKDIAVICNDIDGRGHIIKRVFDEYGISYFIDQKRHALHNPAIVFVSALMDILQSGWVYEDVFRLVKTGFCPLDEESAEDLENYAIRYRIRGGRWKKPFRYGSKEYEPEEFAGLDEARRILAEFIGTYEEMVENASTVSEKTTALCEFLKVNANLESKLEQLCLELEDDSDFEAAMEMQQIWESILNLFDQLSELIGDEKISKEEYALMLKAGFESIELGLIPTTIDQVVVGTMQRTRIGNVKALLVMGANDGILPADSQSDDILNPDERALLQTKDIIICRDDDLRSMEERLAIYKQLSRPENYLWMGFSTADLEGKEIRPSIIFDRLRKMFPDVPVEKDIRNRNDPVELLERPESGLRFLSEALRKAESDGEEPDLAWKTAYNWYREKDHKGLDLIKQGMAFDNKIDNLETSLITRLFGKQDRRELRISPSRLERFSRCPFAHFVHYGLAPKERRIFEVAGREVGDVYHRCLMLFAEELTVAGMALTHEKSPWMRLTKAECTAMIGKIMEKVASEYREGVLDSGEEEKYRAVRMKEVCSKAAWALVGHVRQGQINEIYFEEGFGRGEGRLFPAISVRAGDHELLIEGKIDRIDVLPEDYVKVIDYKSGSEKFDPREALGGWRLQLMIYLKATVEGMRSLNRSAKPAGVFYFEISDSMINADGYDERAIKEKLDTELRKLYKLDGVVLGDPAVIDSIDSEIDEYSEILPVRKNKEGVVAGTSRGKMLTAEEFDEFQSAMDGVIIDLCGKLAAGVIHLHPKKTRNETACKYCDYKSICNFELSFDGCTYDVVK